MGSLEMKYCWEMTTWGELVELKYGKSLKGYRESGGRYPVYGTNGPVGWTEKPLCEFPSVIVGRKGAYRGVHFSDTAFFVIDTAFYVSPKPSVNINLKWAYYALLLADINGMDSGSAIPSTSREDFYALPARLPPLSVQDSIVKQLDALNNKIEINRQINATLESMAQALFKSWFVDFDPVIDNALAAGNPIPEPLQARADKRAGLHVWRSDEDARRASAPEGACQKRAALLAAASEADTRSPSATDNAHPIQTAPHTQPGTTASATPLQPLPADLRALFPDSFVFNEEMGWVPEGWASGSLSDVAKLITKSIHPGKQPDKLWMHFSIPAFDENQRPSVDLGESIKSGKYMVPKESVLASKLNPEFPRIWFPDVVSEDDAVCSTEFMPFVPIDPEERPFLYLLLKSEAIQTEIANRATGSTGSRQRVKPKEVEALPMLHPSKELRIAFSSHVKGMLERIRLNSGNNEALSRVRDALLPKLLSGQVQLPDVEQLAAEAL